MVQAIRSTKVTLGQLEQHFGLTAAQEPAFFSEWRTAQATATHNASEVERLARIKTYFNYLLRTPPILEGAVKMIVLSPLLELAGFYEPPFGIRAETETEISSFDPEEEVVVRGAIDALVLKEQLWILVIESKMSDFSLTKALPQTLSYMLASPELTTFGLILNGSDFVFVKLERAAEGQPQSAQYATSKVFSFLSPDNELADVLSILKYLGNTIR